MTTLWPEQDFLNLIGGCGILRKLRAGCEMEKNMIKNREQTLRCYAGNCNFNHAGMQDAGLKMSEVDCDNTVNDSY